MKKLIVAAMLLGLSGQAVATDWWLFDGGNFTCVNAAQAAIAKDAPVLATPYTFRQEARQSRSYKGTSVYHLGDGQLGVDIKAFNSHMDYFSSLSACLDFKKYFLSHGHHAANLNELK
jgi:hypothetical protein